MIIFENFFKYLVLVIGIPNTQADTTYINNKVEEYIFMSINYTVDPCDNFYDYACGDYSEQHRTKYYQEMTSLMDFQYNELILNIIDSCFQYDFLKYQGCQSFVEKTRNYLKACRHESKRNLTRYFEDIKPGPQLNWPILQKVSKPWSAAAFDVWTLLGKLQSYGLNNALINHEITVDKFGEFNIILEPAYSENDSTLADFNILEVLLMALEVQDAKYILNNLKKTDGMLLGILQEFQETNEENQQLTYGDLKQQYPELNLHLYLQELLTNRLTADTPVMLKNPKYFQYLNETRQSLQTAEWCNYLMMKFLYYLAVDSTAEFNGLGCVKDLRNKMDLAVNFLYYQQKYARKAKLYNKAVEEIYENIRNKFGKLFMTNRLNLTMTQVQFLSDKLQNVRLNLGNLPDGITLETVEKFYENVPNLDKTNYYKNHLHLLKHRFQKSLHYAPEQTYFIVTDNRLGSSSGAFYVPQQNMIILPFGSLAFPLFDPHFYDVYKYSLLGFILAHEFTHAFDTTGLNFNGMGVLIHTEDNSDILDNLHFQDALKCLQSQLPTDSIDERMADIVGIDVIFKIIAEKMSKDIPFEDQKHVLKHYYLNLAQFFCGKSNIKFLDHDSDAQRLNQIIMNSESFAYAFQCHRNSEMNPNNKCRVY